MIDQTKDRGGGRHRNKYQKRGQEANQALSATAQHLLSLRKTLKIASTSYRNAAIQENLLQSYWDREITPKGLKISKPCVAFKKAESEIEEQFKDILHDAEEGLHCSLMQHLGEVARKCKQVVNTTECEMATAAEIANTTEVITHERFLSATRHNINKSKGLKHHRACNKLNEVSGRRERFRSSRFYQLVENTSLNRPEHQRQYPMGAIPTTTNKSDTPIMNITPAPKNPNINPNHVTPSITLITQNQIPPPAPPLDQTLMSNHPPHVIPTENNQPTRVTPEVSEHSTHVNPTETNHPTSANHPMSAIPMLAPTTYLPSSSLITMSHSNVCVTVSTDNLLPKKIKLPPGPPKAKMTPQEDQEELQESREDLDSFEQSAMDEQRTPITVAPAPIQTQETTTRESERHDTEEHTTPSRAAATAPGHRSENVLNTTPQRRNQERRSQALAKICANPIKRRDHTEKTTDQKDPRDSQPLQTTPHRHREGSTEPGPKICPHGQENTRPTGTL